MVGAHLQRNPKRGFAALNRQGGLCRVHLHETQQRSGHGLVNLIEGFFSRRVAPLGGPCVTSSGIKRRTHKSALVDLRHRYYDNGAIPSSTLVLKLAEAACMIQIQP